MRIDIPVLYLIIPCYNEESVLPITAPHFLEVLLMLIDTNKIHEESRILFIDDGSKDSTWKYIEELHRETKYFIGLSLSRNCGHQNALLAGLLEAGKYSDITISIDCDGQDDLCAIEKMVDAYTGGSDVVYGVRSDRSSDSLFKRITAESFYRLLNFMGVEAVFNHADYRLISKRVLNELENFHEVNLFLRGLIPLIGFNSSLVYYERHERLAGKSHYSISKMLALAFDGITSLSIKPIRIITGFGMLVAVVSVIGIIWSLTSRLNGNTVQGWTSMVCITCFLGGVQLISLGVIGEYIGKSYLETKRRPRYIISRKLGLNMGTRENEE